MIPNKYVLFWNDSPTKIIVNNGIKLKKVQDPEDITFYNNKLDAEMIISKMPITYILSIKEIQFRIV